MLRVKKDIMRAVRTNKDRESGNKHYNELLTNVYNNSNRNYENKPDKDPLENIIDIR